jgi:hypothetical protein
VADAGVELILMSEEQLTYRAAVYNAITGQKTPLGESWKYRRTIAQTLWYAELLELASPNWSAVGNKVRPAYRMPEFSKIQEEV